MRRSPSTIASNRHAAPRLACVKPVASVHPEPGSNSSLYNPYLLRASRENREEHSCSLSQNDYPVFFQKAACATFPRIKRFASSTQYRCNPCHATVPLLVLLCLCKPFKDRSLDALMPRFLAESGCKGTNISETHQTFQQLFSNIVKVFPLPLQYG